MRVPVFDESLRTGHPIIDEQHEWLFKLAARVAKMMGVPEPAGDSPADDHACTPRARDAATEAVYGLLDYATEHFSDEEALQREAHYPLASVHASLHADLSRRLAPFVLQEVNDEKVAPDEITEFLVDWLTSHILEHDRQFTSWLEENPPVQGSV